MMLAATCRLLLLLDADALCFCLLPALLVLALLLLEGLGALPSGGGGLRGKRTPLSHVPTRDGQEIPTPVSVLTGGNVNRRCWDLLAASWGPLERSQEHFGHPGSPGSRNVLGAIFRAT